MPKKSQKKWQKNAFFFFMLHFQKTERRRGCHYQRAALPAAASPSWMKMNAQQRAPFVKRANDAKLAARRKVEKLTSKGIDEEKEQLEKSMMHTIKTSVWDAFNANTIGSREFIFISGNYFVNIDEYYLPAEIAMVKFTFENGIVNKFHTYVDPEEVPMGYQCAARDHSVESHRLPIPPNAKGERNYRHILDEINKFVGEPTPILFTSKEYIPMIKSFIQTFVDFGNNDGDDNMDRYRVYPLHQLFFEIKEEAVKNSLEGISFKSIHIAEQHLKRDDYVYLTNTACTYHEEMDSAKDCALAHVQNWAFIFVDHICVDLNIQPIAGKHFPPEITISN